MEGSVGASLRLARLKKKMTVEEVARATKIRAARIVDLENDEYDRFPNLAYARSFLLMYAKYLGIDISKYRTMEVGSPAGVGDYQYLQNEGGVDSLRFTRPRPVDAPVQNLRWLPAVVTFMAFLIFGLLTWLFVLKVEQLGPDVGKKRASADKEAATPAASASTPAVSPAPQASPATQAAQAEPKTNPAEGAGVPGANGAESPVPKAVPVDGATSPLPLRALPADGSIPPPVGEPEVRRAEPVTGTPLPAHSPEASMGAASPPQAQPGASGN